MGFLDLIQQNNRLGGPNFGGPIGSIRPGMGWSRNPDMDNDLIEGIKRANATKLAMEMMRISGNGVGNDGGVSQSIGNSGGLGNRIANGGGNIGGGLRFQDSPNGGPTPIDNLLTMHRNIGAEQEGRQEAFTKKQEEENRYQQNFGLKAAETQNKINETQNKLTIAEEKIKSAELKLSQNALDMQAKRELDQAKIDALTANHELTIKQKQAELEAVTKAKDDALAEAKRAHDLQYGDTIETEEFNADGTKKTTTKTRTASTDEKVQVIKQSDGSKWMIPKSRLSAYLANGYSQGSALGSSSSTLRPGVTTYGTPAGVVPK